MSVHSTAIVHASAVLGDVEVGPYAVIGADVTLADGVRIGAHCVLEGPLVIGRDTVLHAHVVLGGTPQDKKHDPAVRTELVVGERNVFHEFTTAHRGTSGGRKRTTIGDDNTFMANSHVAHDCILGNGIMFANSAAIGGHVEIADGAVLGGLCAVHQFCRIGRLAMVGGGAMCAQDVPPFAVAQGDRARLYGLNIIGLRRAGLDLDVVSVLKEAWRTLFVEGLPRQTALLRVQEAAGNVPEVAEMLQFIRQSERGVCRAGLAH